MIQKKVCLVGDVAVGKTSLVRRFVDSIYTDKYHTTVGVKVDKKVVSVGAVELTLLVWDIEGAEAGHELRTSYLRGASGYLLIADGTRPDTLARALELQAIAEQAIGPVPFLLLLNKADLVDQWEVGHPEKAINTSAKTGQGVEEAFLALAQKMMQAPNG